MPTYAVLHSTAPVAASRATIGFGFWFVERDAYTIPFRTPPIHAIHSRSESPPYGSVTVQRSAPVSRSRATMRSPALLVLGKPDWRTT